MISIEEFEQLAENILSEIPQEFLKDLNGGIILVDDVRLHSISTEKSPVYIRGLYHHSPHLGNRIEIFYGSFAITCRNFTAERIERELKDVILHEIRHHVETMAGDIDLIIQDEKDIATILKRRRKNRRFFGK